MHLFVYLFYLYQALDCIMTQAVRTSIQFNTVGRSFFPAKGEVLDVGFGKEVPAVLRIHDILGWIRIRIWIRGSMPLTNF
jgi:hypothetical protein